MTKFASMREENLLAGNRFHGNFITDNMEFLQWSCHDVGRWIGSLGFPLYKVRETKKEMTLTLKGHVPVNF